MLLRSLTALAVAASAALGSITSCGSPAARLQLTRLDLFPDPPAPGEEMFMAVEFQNPGAPVAHGTAKRTVTLNGLPVVDETVGLCPDATTCPLATGFNNRSATTSWPDVTGKVVSTIRWYDESAAELLCIKTSVTVPSGNRLRGHHHHTHSAVTALGGIWTPHIHSTDLIIVPSKDVAIWYAPVPAFNNATQCGVYQSNEVL
jgi:hypothetical protein